MGDSKFKITAIAFSDSDYAIGSNGGLLINEPVDLRIFKDFTAGKVLLVGRKTFESLPVDEGFCLSKDRLLIVVTSQPDRDPQDLPRNAHWLCIPENLMGRPGRIAKLAVSRAESVLSREVRELCVIGGGELYRLMERKIGLFVLNRALNFTHPSPDTWLKFKVLKRVFRGATVKGKRCDFVTEIYQ